MTGLNLPTDNLYKFMAIAGVSIALFSIYLMFTRAEQGTARVDQLERESTVLFEEEHQVEIAWEKLKDKTGPRAKSLEDARNEIKKRKARNYEEVQATMRFGKLNLLLVKDLQVAHYVGVVLAVVGFFLWYFKVQRFMDKAIREEARLKK